MAGTLLLGLITGIAFGFVIFKVGASRFDKIVRMLLLKDFTILKFMMMAVMAAAVGIFLTNSVIYIAPLQLVRLIVGGLIFGVGFALLGACPGTVMVALGEGKKDARWGILGGLAGAAVFAHFYTALEKPLLTALNYGPLTIHSSLGLGYGAGLAILLVVFGGSILIINKLTAPRGDKAAPGTEAAKQMPN
jgi:uncharacterized membrane protein YedE/YeeE